VTRGLRTTTRDITSGIPRIEALLEIRTQTGVPLLLDNLYQYFLTKGFPNWSSSRKALHFGQRILVDRVQRHYRINGVTLNDKHLELIVCPIAFAKVIQDRSRKKPVVHGEEYQLEILERMNWLRSLENMRNELSIHRTEPRIFYKPLLLGLTISALRNASFLSAASFQETSRVLTVAALRGRTDFLLGLKENLILGTRLPIGTNARFFTSNVISKDILSQGSSKANVFYFEQKEKNIALQNKRLSWSFVLHYLEKDSLFV
jgi:hypothetical protein